MEDKPYAIIVDGNGGVSERVLASHMGSAASPAGSLLEPSIKVMWQLSYHMLVMITSTSKYVIDN